MSSNTTTPIPTTQASTGAIQATSTTVAGFPALHAEPRPGDATRPPALFLHGAFADEYGFEDWVARFATAGYPSLAPARRGRRGVGPDRAKGLTFDDYVQDTIAIIDELPEPPVIIGHSLGALVAQRLAEQGRARAVVLLAPAPPAMLTAQMIALPRFVPNMPKIMTGRPFIVGNDACSVLALNQVPDDERADIHAHLTHESGRVYRACMLGTIRVDASTVTVPVLVAGGNQDRIVSTRLLRKTAKHYGVEPHIYDDHGHWILQEPGWEQVADDVLAWLADRQQAADE